MPRSLIRPQSLLWLFWLAAYIAGCSCATADVPLNARLVGRSFQIIGDRASQSEGADLKITFQNHTQRSLKINGSDYIPEFNVSRLNGKPVESDSDRLERLQGSRIYITRCLIPDPFVLRPRGRQARHYRINVWEGYTLRGGRYRVSLNGTSQSWLLKWSN